MIDAKNEIVTVSGDLVKQITELHIEANSLAERAIERAIRVGELLHQVRTSFPKRAGKGEGFEVWVEANLPFSGRMARRYIRAFENRDTIDLSTTLKENLQRLTSPKPNMDTGVRNEDVPPATEAVRATWTEEEAEGEKLGELEPKDERKAKDIAVFFGVDMNKARSWVLSKKNPDTKKGRRKKDKNKLVAVTIRFAPDEVDIMESVARKESKKQGRPVPLAEIAREHHRLGASQFAKKYGVTKR